MAHRRSPAMTALKSGPFLGGQESLAAEAARGKSGFGAISVSGHK
jgi:hypothetical protein